MKFNIGDRVEVVNNGRTYTSYRKWVEKYAPDFLSIYTGRTVREGKIGTILARGMHDNNYNELFLLEIDDGDYITLIDNEGIKLIEGDKKMKLKLELFRYENVVFGKVLEQSEDLRGMSKVTHNGFKITSVSDPELYSDTLFIRGYDKSKDHFAFSRTFDSIEKAKEVVENIKVLVDKLNEVEEKVVAPNGNIIQIM